MDDRPTQLRDMGKVVSWISELTGEHPDTCARRLRDEYAQPGFNVSRALAEAGVAPYTWSDDMARFYSETDAFLYELVIWNLNALKAWMRDGVARYVDRLGHGAKVLNIGDGLGIDTVHLARMGHKPTYFELPGFNQRFAERVLADAGVQADMITDESAVPREAFDAVVCLDVLEHVPDPPAFVEQLAGYLKPSGWLVIHESFLWVHPSNPTHLAACQKYSGDLSLYTRFGFRVVDGEIGWNPIVLEKPGPNPRPKAGLLKQCILRLAGWYMALGRYSVMPFAWGDGLRRRKGRWFDDPVPVAESAGSSDLSEPGRRPAESLTPRPMAHKTGEGRDPIEHS